MREMKVRIVVSSERAAEKTQLRTLSGLLFLVLHGRYTVVNFINL